jgi:cytochrome P450
MKKLVSPAFTARGLAAGVEPALAGIAESLWDRVRQTGAVEVVADIAEPMATRVISKLLNVAREDEKWMVKTADDMLEAEADPSNVALREAHPKNLADLRAFFAERLEDERKNPSGGFLTNLIANKVEGDSLSPEELLANTMILVIAGIETTKRLISNVLYLLVTHPPQFQELRQDSTLLKPAIEETLRFHSPNQTIMRYAQSDVEFHGVAMARGTRIYGMRGSAHRDPEVWQDPNQYDIRRFLAKVPPHLGFGLGPHMCIGAYLARREAAVVTETVMKNTSNLRLDPAADLKFVGFRNRGPKELRLLFDPA